MPQHVRWPVVVATVLLASSFAGSAAAVAASDGLLPADSASQDAEPVHVGKSDTVADGVYVIGTSDGSVLATSDGDAVLATGRAGRWRLERDGGHYRLHAVGSDACLYTDGSSAYLTDDGGDGTLWNLESDGNGGYALRSVSCGRTLDASEDGRLVVSDGNGVTLGLTGTRPIKDGTFTFVNGGSALVPDGTTAGLAGDTMATASRWNVAYDDTDGYYAITSTATGQALSADNGTLRLATPNADDAAQRWEIGSGDAQTLVNGKTGQAVCVRDGRATLRDAAEADTWTCSEGVVQDGVCTIRQGGKALTDGGTLADSADALGARWYVRRSGTKASIVNVSSGKSVTGDDTTERSVAAADGGGLSIDGLEGTWTVEGVSGTIPEGTYRLMDASGRMVRDDGTSVRATNGQELTNDDWKVGYGDDGTATLTNAATGRALSVDGTGRWTVEPADGGGILVVAGSKGLAEAGDGSVTLGDAATWGVSAAHATKSLDDLRREEAEEDEKAAKAAAAKAKADARQSSTEGVGVELARLAVKASATASPECRLQAPNHDVWQKLDDSRLSTLYYLNDHTLRVWGGNTALASCTQAAAAVVGAVLDPDIAAQGGGSQGPQQFMAWCESHPDVYRKVAARGMSDLEPGDVLCTSGHTAIYVGNAIAREKYPNTDGNLYEAAYGPALYPGIDHCTDDDFSYMGYTVFRPIAKAKNPAHGFVVS